MSFKKVKAQELAISFLSNTIDGGRIANAYIFHGPAGVGKKLTALAFAKAINCAGRIEKAESCDMCAACKKIDSANHPDVHLVEPEEEGSAIGIDQIRIVIRDAGLKPYEAAKKVYIIDEANNLTEEAAGALLKTLEEPSSDSVLILIAEDTGRLLPTIRSRCQEVKFFPLDRVLVKELLIQEHGIDEMKAHVLAGISCGQMQRALKLNDEKFFDRRARIIEALAAGTASELDFDKIPKADLRVQLDIMLTWYRDLLVTKFGGMSIVNLDKKDALTRRAKMVDATALDTAIHQIIMTQSYLGLNANAKLAMAALGSAL